MPENAILQNRGALSRISDNMTLLAKFLQEIQRITIAAREVTWERYHSDLEDNLGRSFPGLSLAISHLSDLVGVPTTREHDAASQPTREANQSP